MSAAQDALLPFLESRGCLTEAVADYILTAGLDTVEALSHMFTSVDRAAEASPALVIPWQMAKTGDSGAARGYTTVSPPEQDPLWKLTWYMYRPGMEF